MLATAKHRAALLPVLAVAAILLLILAALLLGYEPAGAQSGAPTITAVAITSDAGDDDTYLLGDVIRITLTFCTARVVRAPCDVEKFASGDRSRMVIYARHMTF